MPLVLVVALLGATVRIYFALQSMHFLITELIPDDAFYYFVISRNTALGRGISFDGINPTNGIHPLWMVLLVPVFALLEGAASVRAPLLIGALFDVVAGLLIYLVLRNSLRRAGLIAVPVAFVVFSMWMFSPFAIRQSLNGLETSLNLLLLTTVIFLMMRLKVANLSSVIVVSAIWGLVLLSRTDTILFWIPAIAFIFLRAPKKNLKPIVVSVFTTLLVLSPWIIWNLLTFDTVVQSSAVAMPQFIRANWLAETGQEATPFRILSHIKSLIWLDFRRLLTFSGLAPRAIIVVVALCILILLTTKKAAHSVLSLLQKNAYLLVGLAAWFIVHDGIRWMTRDWYFVVPVLIVWLSVAFLVAGAFTVFRIRGWTSAGVLFAALLIFQVSAPAVAMWNQLVPTLGRTPWPWQARMLEGANWIRESLPEDAFVGSWNAGILGFYSERVVTNLDGVVNNEILSYVRNNQVCEYLNDANVEFVAEFDSGINAWAPFWVENGEPRVSLEPIWLASGVGNPFSVYRFNGNC